MRSTASCPRKVHDASRDEGSAESSWILQDFGDIVLHVFTAEARKLYDLENLWADAVPVDWQAYLDSLKSA